MPIRSTTLRSCSRVCNATNDGYGADSCRSGAARVFRRERGAAADPELVVDVREVVPRATYETVRGHQQRVSTTQALFALSGSGIFLLLSRRSHTNGSSSTSFSSCDTPPAPEPKYRTP